MSQKIDWATIGYAEILMSSSQNIPASQTTLQFSTIGSQAGSIVSSISSNKIYLAPGVYLVMCQVFFRWSSTPSSNQEIILRLKKNNDSTLICNSSNGGVSGIASAGSSVFGIASISSGDNIFVTIAPTSVGVAEYSLRQTRLEIIKIG